MSTRLPDELLRAPRPRPAWLLSPFWYHLLAFLIAAGGIALAVAAAEATTKLAAGEGPPAGTGEVTGAETRAGYRGQRRATVTFTHEGTTSSCQVHLDDAGKLQAGQSFPYWIVEGYLDTELLLEPCARMARAKAPSHVAILTGLAALTLGAAVLVYILERRRYGLFTHGAAAAGRVLAVGTRGGKGGPRWVVDFQVDAPVSIKDKCTIARRRFAQMTRQGEPRPGDTVYVVYDPDKPSRNEIWGFAS